MTRPDLLTRLTHDPLTHCQLRLRLLLTVLSAEYDANADDIIDARTNAKVRGKNSDTTDVNRTPVDSVTALID